MESKTKNQPKPNLQIGGDQKGRRRGWAKWAKGVKCMGMDGNLTFGSDHFVKNTEVNYTTAHLKLI